MDSKGEQIDGPEQTCTKNFVPINGGKQCYGACAPAGQGNGEVTYGEAVDLCKDLGLRLPSSKADLEKHVNTGCDLDKAQIWYSVDAPSKSTPAE
jgi:hypothetical protein